MGVKFSNVITIKFNDDKRCICTIGFNSVTNAVHVMDKSEGSGLTTITNAIEYIQEPILKKLDLPYEDVNDYVWILYGTDNVESIYKDGNFKLIE